MRMSRFFLASLAVLAACGPTLERHRDPARAIRVLYDRILPPCPATPLGRVQGARLVDLQREALRMHADAIILNDTTGRLEGTPSARYSGTAVRWSEGDSCPKS